MAAMPPQFLFTIYPWFILSTYFQKNLSPISHDLPAVYDVFTVAIKERAAFQQLQKCGWSEAWERSDLAEWNPDPPTGGEA
jgi:hypothetical protein